MHLNKSGVSGEPLRQSIQAVDVPFLPLTMTVGTTVGAATLSREAKPTFRRWSGAVCLFVILVIWAGFYAASASFARRESFRLIVIKLTSDSQPLHWVQILKDIGALVEPVVQPQPVVAGEQSEEDGIRRIAIALVDGGLRRQKFFGLPLPELDEVEES